MLYLPESKDQKLRNVVVIKTKNLTRAVAEFLELSMEDEVVKELERLKLQLEPMKKSIEAVERKASNYANLVTLSGFGLLVGQFTLFAHLTWGELSWDIMEPITYFAGQVNLILAYAYFIFVKREQTLTDVWETAANRRKSKLYRKMGIDPGFVFKLQESIQKREALLAHFGNNKPNTSTSKAS